jgi:hypothetical protein
MVKPCCGRAANYSALKNKISATEKKSVCTQKGLFGCLDADQGESNGID